MVAVFERGGGRLIPPWSAVVYGVNPPCSRREIRSIFQHIDVCTDGCVRMLTSLKTTLIDMIKALSSSN